MTTFNTDTGTFGHISTVDNKPHPERSAADKAGGSIEFHSDGSSTHKAASKGPQTVDLRAKQLEQIAASANGPSSQPLAIRTRSGVGATAAQAELNPSRFMISILGRETSVQAALTTGWIVKGADGNFYDRRAMGNPTPGK